MKAKRITAILVMLLVVAAAVIIGPMVSLNNMREDAEDRYYHDEIGFSTGDGIDIRKDAANNILKIAAKYKDTAELDSQVNELERAVQVMENSYDWIEKGKANKELDAPAKALIEQLKSISLDEADLRYLKGQEAELVAQQDKINRSDYNAKAQAFNERLTHFPGRILNSFGWIEPLPIFEENS